MTANAPTTVTTTTTPFTGPPMLAEVFYFQLTNWQVYGPDPNGPTITSNDPVFEFVTDHDATIWAITIPIVDLTGNNGYHLFWEVYDDLGSSPIRTGDIHELEIQSMIRNNHLLISFGSIQETEVMNGMGLDIAQGENYYVVFSSNSTFTLTMDVSSVSSSDLHFYEDTIPHSSTPQIVLYEGIHVATELVDGSGGTSTTVNPGSHSFFLLAYFGDQVAGIYSQSHDFQFIEIEGAIPPTVNISPVSTSTGETIDLVANVLHYGVPVIGEEVEFSILKAGVYQPIGSPTTQIGGVASLTYQVSEIPSSYNYRAETTINGHQGLAVESYIVTKPNAQWMQLDASGSYGSMENQKTSVLIEGKLLTQGGSAIADETVEIYQSTSLIGAVSTDQFGDFSLSQTESLDVGLYEDHYRIHYPGNFWDIDDTNLNLTIIKGSLVIGIPDYSTEYINQPVVILGFVKDTSNTPIDLLTFVDRYDTPLWTEISSTTPSGGMFTAHIDHHSVGLYQMRIRIPETSNYFSATKQFQFELNTTNGSIDRQGEPFGDTIDYHGSVDLKARILDHADISMEGVTVDFYRAEDIAASNFVFIGSTTSTSGGWATYAWAPDLDTWADMDSNGLIQFPITVRVVARSQNFSFAPFTYDVNVLPTDISFDLSIDKTVYDSPAKMTITATDARGYPTDANTVVSLTVEGFTYFRQTDINGQTTVYHTFSTVGGLSIQVEYDNADNFYYNNLISSYPITVQKGQFNFSAIPLTVSQGEYVDFTTVVHDHNGAITPNVDLTLLIFDTTWKNKGTHTADGNGIMSSNVLITMGPNMYDYKWVYAESTYYNGSETVGTLDVSSILTEIILEVDYPGYSYGVSDSTLRSGIVTLKIPSLNNPVVSKIVNLQMGSFSWSVTTDSNGKASFEMPKFIDTGIWILRANYTGDGTYTETNSSIQVTVDGTETTLSWIIAPQETYFGDILEFTVQATYDQGIPLPNMQLHTTIGGINVDKVTNESGMATFSVELRSVSGSALIQIEMDAHLGYTNASLLTTISNPMKQLYASTNDSQIYYDQDVQLESLINSTSENYLSGINVELLWFNSTTFQYQSILFTQSNGSGWIDLLINLPEQSAGTIYKLQWSATHPDYLTGEHEFTVDILTMPLTPSFIYSSGRVGHGTPIDVLIVDIDGRPVEGLDVTLSYVPFAVEWEETQVTNTGGLTRFTMTLYDAGTLDIAYSIIDFSNNYQSQAFTFSIYIAKDIVSIAITLDDTSGVSTITGMVTSSLDTTTTHNVTLLVEEYDISWILLGNTDSINGYFSFPVIINQDTQFRISILGDPNIEDYQYELIILQQDVTITFAPDPVFVFDAMQFDAVLTGNSSFHDYEVKLSYLDGTWNDLGSYYSSNGVFVDAIPLNLFVGDYSLMIEFPQQGWFRPLTIIVPFTVELGDVTLTYNSTQFGVNTQNRLRVTVDSSYEVDLSGVQVILFIGDGGWVPLATGITESNGTVDLTFQLDYPIGTYNFKLESTGTVYVNPTMALFNGQLREETVIIGYQETVASYLSPGSISILLNDRYDNPLEFEEIAIHYFDGFDWQPLSKKHTDGNGFLLIDIPTIFNPGIVQIMFSYAGDGYYGDSNLVLDYLINLEPTNLELGMVDYGISNNLTIQIGISYEQGYLSGGLISWRIVTSGGTEFGNGVLVFNDELVIPGTLVGSYILELRYTDSDGLFAPIYEEIPVGWMRINTPEVGIVDTTLEYGRDNQLQIQVGSNDSSLTGIEVSISQNQVTLTMTSDQSGTVYFDISHLLPGTYNITVHIPSSDYTINAVTQRYEIIIDRGRSGFEFSFTNPVYPDGVIRLNISDQHKVGATYDMELVNGGSQKQTFSISSTSQSVSINGLYPGEYTLRVIRMHSYFYKVTITKTLVVVGIESIISIEQTDGNNSILLSFDSSPMEGSDRYTKSFDVTIALGDETLSYQNVTKINMTLFGKGYFELEIKAIGFYSGFSKTTIYYEFSDLIDDTIPDDEPSSSSSFGFITNIPDAVYGGMFGVGLGTYSLIIRYRKKIND
jgi:hypothetical protein